MTVWRLILFASNVYSLLDSSSCFVLLCFVLVFFSFSSFTWQNIHTFLFILAMQLTCKHFLAKRLIMCKWSFLCVSPHHLLWMMVTIWSEMFCVHVRACVCERKWNGQFKIEMTTTTAITALAIVLLQSHGNRTNRIRARTMRLCIVNSFTAFTEKFIHGNIDLSYQMFVCFVLLSHCKPLFHPLALSPRCCSFFAN